MLKLLSQSDGGWGGLSLNTVRERGGGGGGPEVPFCSTICQLRGVGNCGPQFSLL